MGHELPRPLYGSRRSLECVEFKTHGNGVFINPGSIDVYPRAAAGGIISEFHKIKNGSIVLVVVIGTLCRCSQTSASGINVEIERLADRKQDPPTLNEGQWNGMMTCS